MLWFTSVFCLISSKSFVVSGLTRRWSAEELIPSNCGVGVDSWEPAGQQDDQLANLKGNQPWILIRRTDAEAETPVFWSSDANSWLFGKVPDAGKDWGQEEKKASEDEMAEWHPWCNGHELG